jgi:ankyrin repeat protein
MENNIHTTLETTLKLYELGKKTLDIDREKAILCFKKAIDNINLLKKLNVDTSRLSLLQTTETECFKFINSKKNIFQLIDESEIEEIKKIENINFREINSDGNTVLHHCINIGDTSILKELLKKGGCIDQVNGNGNTLLEYACLNKDPNLINFLLKHGANMDKHLFFRKNYTEAYLNKSDIDSAILLKLVIKNCKDGDNSLFTFLDNYFSWNELVGLNKHTIMDLSIGLTAMFKNKKCYETFKQLIIDDLNNYKNNNLKKGINKVDYLYTIIYNEF